MAINLIEYPVTTAGGRVLNVLSGFNPIYLMFSRSVSDEVGVEVVLTEWGDVDTDLLGFSLFSDFDLDNLARIDVSIINDQNSLNINLGNITEENSRVKFRVKYRTTYEDGTTSAWTWLDSEYPIIAYYSNETPELYEVLNDADLPAVYRGYPAPAGFVTSDANLLGNIRMYMDFYDITETIITFNVLLRNYGISPIGLNVFNINQSSDDTPISVPNSGGNGTSDWYDGNGDGLADGWYKSDVNKIATIVTGNGFTGNAQRVEVLGTAFSLMMRYEGDLSVASSTYTIKLKYRSYTISDLHKIIVSPKGGYTTDTLYLPNNTGDAVEIEFTGISVNPNLFGISFHGDTAEVGEWLEVDEIQIIPEPTTVNIPSNAAFVDFKIITDY